MVRAQGCAHGCGAVRPGVRGPLSAGAPVSGLVHRLPGAPGTMPLICRSTMQGSCRATGHHRSPCSAATATQNQRGAFPPFSHLPNECCVSRQHLSRASQAHRRGVSAQKPKSICMTPFWIGYKRRSGCGMTMQTDRTGLCFSEGRCRCQKLRGHGLFLHRLYLLTRPPSAFLGEAVAGAFLKQAGRGESHP